VGGEGEALSRAERAERVNRLRRRRGENLTNQKTRKRGDVEHIMVCSDVHVPYHNPAAVSAQATMPASRVLDPCIFVDG
jgi:hypothetical protein